MDIVEWIEEFLIYLKQAGRSAWTLRQYGWHLRKLAAHLAKERITTPDEVTRHVLRRWNADLADRWSPATRRQAVAAARTFFRFLAEEGIIDDNPAAGLTLPRVPTRTQRTLTEEEIAQLLNTAAQLPSPRRERETALVALLTDSGLRAGETCRLRVTDLNIEKGMLSVVGKGNREAKALFGPETAAFLEEWIGVRNEWLSQQGLTDPATVFVALGGPTPGRPLTTDGLRKILLRLGEKAGVEHVSPHAFRRAFATLIVVNGASTRIAQVLGRWSNVGMVERYTRALEEGLDGEMRELYRQISPIGRILRPKQLPLPL